MKFTNDIIWVGLAQLFNSIILGIVVLPALTKSYGPETYGIWVQVNTAVFLLSPLISMQLGMAAVRFMAGEQDRVRRRRALGTMLSAIVVLSFLVLVVANLLASQLSNFLFASPNYIGIVRLTSLWIIVNALFNFFLMYLLALNKIKLLSIRKIVYSLMAMTLVIALAANGINLKWLITAMITLQVAFVLFFYIMIVFELGFPIPNVTGLSHYLAFSLPQVPGGIMLWIISSSDRYFITHFLGLAQTGIYSASSTLANLTILFYAPISVVLYPLVSKLWDENRRSEVQNYLEYSTKLFITLAIPASVGLAILSQPLLKLLTTTEFLAGEYLVLLLAIGSIFLGLYQININIVLLTKKTKFLPLITAAAAMTSLALNIVLIPYLGIAGAAISNIASYFVLAAIVTLWAKITINYRFDLKFLFKVILSTMIMAICLYFMKTHGVWGLVLAVIVGAVLFVAIFLLLRPFSLQDKQLIGKIISSYLPGLGNKEN